MTKGQIILSVVSVALIGVLYFFVPTKAQKQGNEPTANRDMAAVSSNSPSQSFDLKSYKQEKINDLDQNLQNQIADLYKENTKDAMLQLNELYVKNGIPLMACEVIKSIAEKESNETNWLKAGDAFNAVAMIEQKNGALIQYAMQQSVEAYQKAVDINPNNIDNQLKLAAAIMESTEQPMQGVQILLKIVEKNPDHIPANVMLGRYGIVSGQYDKAVSRLEKVVKLDPKNTEALFYLAEAYNGLGRKEEAVKTFEQCKKMVNDASFSAEIDNYINKIKNS